MPSIPLWLIRALALAVPASMITLVYDIVVTYVILRGRAHPKYHRVVLVLVFLLAMVLSWYGLLALAEHFNRDSGLIAKPNS